MTLELAQSLVVSEAVPGRAVARALFLSTTQQMAFVQALVITGAASEATLDAATSGPDGPSAAPQLTTVTPSLALVEKLPKGYCARLLAVPIGTNTTTGAVELALVDPRDTHAVREAAYFLQAPVDVRRASVSALRAAIEAIQRADSSYEPPPPPERSRTPIWGTPVVSVAPPVVPHAQGDMPIPLMRRSSLPSAPTSARPAVRIDREPVTERDVEPVFALRPPTSVRRPALAMIAETRINEAPLAPTTHAAVTIPAPKQDPRHTMVTAPAPARRSEKPPVISVPRQTRVPAAPQTTLAPALPLADVEPVLAAMAEANDRDAIVALLVSGMRTCARRVAILAVKRDAFVGWSCNAEFGDARAWRSVRVPFGIPSVLATAAAGTTYLGPLFRTDGHEPILAFMKEASRDVAVTGVRVDMHPALVLLADELADTALGTKRIEQLAKAASTALARMLRRPAGKT